MNSILRLGIIGTGFIAEIIANAVEITEGIELRAVASRAQETAEAFSAKHTGVKTFSTWQELVAWDSIDAVYVATPTYVREEICLAAASYNKHILADKPFTSIASLQAITRVCRNNGLAFMDATHFVHHPRSKQLKKELEQRIGKVHSIHSAFFFPSTDTGNIRYDPEKEPAGAIGDMAWYCMRAIVEFMTTTTVLSATGHAIQDKQTGAVISGTGVMSFADGCTSTWSAGYNTGALLMNLDILGSDGIISIDDFVLDWAGSFISNNPSQVTGFRQRNGIMNPPEFQWIATPSPKLQTVLMLEKFIALIQKPTGEASETSIKHSEQTQILLDSIWSHLELR